jgi:acetyl esterase/lipase
MWKKLLIGAVVAVVVLAGGIYAAFQFSPWPSVLLIRHAFAQGADETTASIAHLVPKDVVAQRNLIYAPGQRDAGFDVYAPKGATAPLPAVIWVHGGGFVSGTRSDLSGYMQILASRRFVTVPIDYTVAPTARFPSPLRQTNAAIAYILANAKRFNIDPERVFLAGDSAGAQIVAQTALIISDPAYARRIGIEPGMPRTSLRGLVLFCGPYDPTTLNFDGAFGGFMRTVIWSYVGTRDPHDPKVAQMSVTPHVTAGYPPAFISVGNADGLAPQSVALAEALRGKGVEVNTLFWPSDYKPPLGHEYQLELATPEGTKALDRAVAFLKTHVEPRPVAASTP